MQVPESTGSGTRSSDIREQERVDVPAPGERGGLALPPPFGPVRAPPGSDGARPRWRRRTFLTPSTESDAKLVQECCHRRPSAWPSRHGINSHESALVSLTSTRVSFSRAESPNKDTHKAILPPSKMQPSCVPQNTAPTASPGDVGSSPRCPVTRTPGANAAVLLLRVGM